MADEVKKDLVLNPDQYAFVLDANKGTIQVYVGPSKTPLSDNDVPVRFEPRSGEFVQSSNSEATCRFITADENSYIVLTNPAPDNKYPSPGTSTQLPELSYGRQIAIPGPARFPLWPGQIAKVLSGHQLRSNEYLIARVYNESEARANWEEKAILKPQAQVEDDGGKKPEEPGSEEGTSGQTGEEGSKEGSDENKSQDEGKKPQDNAPESTLAPISVTESAERLVLGQLLVIKGTEVSFFIPPTGVEVVEDRSGSFVRQAVTLERLEYCLLLDESGEKRYVRGPAVVFPSPTEEFVTKNNEKKFRAIELNPEMGIYVKVIADYKDGPKEYRVGDEIFITGKEQRIYFPREEHSIIRYGDRSIHYAIAIPAGEGRYVLNKKTGDPELVEGPKMFLPDPREQVVVRRVLDTEAVGLYYPDNSEAARHNSTLARMLDESHEGYLTEEDISHKHLLEMSQYSEEDYQAHTPSDEFERGMDYTPPRTITLDTKYDGAVGVNVWTGYAVNVVSKTDTRKVVVGPKSILLGYNEWLEAIDLSTGRPKNRDRTLRTVYLRVKNNTVSDSVKAITKDLVKVEITASYRVNFEGESSKWFDVEDYVGFLTEHIRSIIANEVKNHGIEEFMAGSADIIRDVVLGKNNEGERPGRHFEENGMHVYDVEILEVNIGDHEIAHMLTEAQNETVRETLDLARRQRSTAHIETTEELKRREEEAKTSTSKKTIGLRMSVDKLEAEAEEKRKERDKAAQVLTDAIENMRLEARLARGSKELEATKATDAHEIDVEKQRQDLELQELTATVDSEVKRLQAVSPEFAKAISGMSDKLLATELAKAIGPLSAIHGEGISETFLKLFGNIPAMSPLWEPLGQTLAGNGHGSASITSGQSEESGTDD